MGKLSDKEIRAALISSLERRANAPKATLEEVQVSDGNAIADVVAVYKELHCYEIKGETDSINRIVRQAVFYDQAFPLISLVTTSNHLDRAMQIAPSHWGMIVVFQRSEGDVKMRFVRGARRNPKYRPEIALLSLWRSELVEFASIKGVGFEKMNRKKIAEFIADTNPVGLINENVGSALLARRNKMIRQDNLEPCN